jgi:hypothetical protein
MYIYIYMEIRSYPLFLFRKNLVIWFIRVMHVVLSEIVHGISQSLQKGENNIFSCSPHGCETVGHRN